MNIGVRSEIEEICAESFDYISLNIYLLELKQALEINFVCIYILDR